MSKFIPKSRVKALLIAGKGLLAFFEKRFAALEKFCHLKKTKRKKGVLGSEEIKMRIILVSDEALYVSHLQMAALK